MNSEIVRATETLQSRADELLADVRKSMGDGLTSILKRMTTATTTWELRVVVTKGTRERDDAIYNRTTHKGRTIASDVSKAMKATATWQGDLMPLMARLEELVKRKVDLVVIVIEVGKDGSSVPSLKPAERPANFQPHGREFSSSDRLFLKMMRISPDTEVTKD